ncbi:MAG: methyltransferase domain-containing protein, partial [Candidatus Poribacteria bacterium]|nr:methyltransferase domain-containing protein [Candidatus Poribacteria bacterium]
SSLHPPHPPSPPPTTTPTPPPPTLKPTFAHCLVHLSKPQSNDVFLDPMCGAGTILIERAHAERYGYLLGGDLSVDAIQAAHANIGRKHHPRQLFQWDAQFLPLSHRSVDKIVCNLPFGKQIGEKTEISTLYRQFLKECRRVLKPTGRIVLLTTQRSTLNHLLRQGKPFKVTQQFPIDLLGQRAWIFVCQPGGER